MKYLQKYFLSKRLIDSSFIIIAFLLLAFEIALHISNVLNVSSFVFHILTVVLFIWVLFRLLFYIFSFIQSKRSSIPLKDSFFEIIKPKEFISYLFVFLIAVISLINIFVVSSSIDWSVDFFSKYFLSMCAVLTLAFLFSSETNKNTIRIVTLIVLALSIYFAFSFAIGLSRQFVEVNTTYASGKYLTMNFSNANTCAVVLCFMIGILLYGCFIYRNLIIKIIFALFALCILSFAILTVSRTIYISLGIFVVFAILLIFVFRTSKINPVLIVLLVLSPVIVAGIYVLCINFMQNNSFFSNYTESTAVKTIMSRYYIWVHSFNTIRQNVIFGNYFILFISNYPNLHNSVLDFFAYFGLVPSLLITIYMSYIVFSYSRNSKYATKSQLIALSLFFLAIFTGVGETHVLYFGLGLTFFAFAGLLFINYPFARNSIIENNALLNNISASKTDSNLPRILEIGGVSLCKNDFVEITDKTYIHYKLFALIIDNESVNQLNVGHISIKRLPTFLKRYFLILEVKRLIRCTKPSNLFIDSNYDYLFDERFNKYLNKKAIVLHII